MQEDSVAERVEEGGYHMGDVGQMWKSDEEVVLLASRMKPVAAKTWMRMTEVQKTPELQGLLSG